MKKLVLILGIGIISNLASGANHYNYTKFNKGLFGYNYVNTSGPTSSGGENYYSVTCIDPGLIKCKTGGGINNDDLDLFAQSTLATINEDVDNSIDNGDLSGSDYRKVYRNNNGIETWVTFSTTWTTSTSGEVVVSITVDEVPYQI